MPKRPISKAATLPNLSQPDPGDRLPVNPSTLTPQGTRQNPPIPNKDPYTDGSGGWPIPVMDSGMTFRDVGSLGLRQYGGWVREEFLPQLVGRQAARTYREMLDNSSMVGAMIFAVTQLMREVDWRVQTVNDTPEAKIEGEFVDSLRVDMSHTWDDHIAEALSCLGYGWSSHEIVYKRRNGRKRSGPEMSNSIFNDGRIGWRRLPIRGQDTILKWFFDQNGQIKGVTQQPWVGQLIDIPIEKMLLFRPTVHKNNPEGRSVLRNAYRPYYFVKRLEEQEAIMFERLGGLPVLYVPSALLEGVAAGDAKAMAAFNAYKKIVTNVRVDEQMGVILPSDPYQGNTGPSTVRQYEFSLVTPSGGRTLARTSDAIERYKLEILTTTLADFIQLGHIARGVQNLAMSKIDMFYSAIEGWLNSIADVHNRHGLPRLYDLNGLDIDLMPKYVPDLAQRVDLDVFSNFIMRLAQAGMPLFPDTDLENYIRDAAGLPDIAEEGAYQATEPDQPTPGEPTHDDATATPQNNMMKSNVVLKRIIAASLARRIKKMNGDGANVQTDRKATAKKKQRSRRMAKNTRKD